jgi:Tol biopolymer transport system component
VATRPSTAHTWSEPVNLGEVNTPPRPADEEQANDWRPSLSHDGTTLYFNSAFRDGNISDFFDLWMTTRTKVGHDSRDDAGDEND